MNNNGLSSQALGSGVPSRFASSFSSEMCRPLLIERSTPVRFFGRDPPVGTGGKEPALPPSLVSGVEETEVRETQEAAEQQSPGCSQLCFAEFALRRMLRRAFFSEAQRTGSAATDARPRL